MQVSRSGNYDKFRLPIESRFHRGKPNNQRRLHETTTTRSIRFHKTKLLDSESLQILRWRTPMDPPPITKPLMSTPPLC